MRYEFISGEEQSVSLAQLAQGWCEDALKGLSCKNGKNSPPEPFSLATHRRRYRMSWTQISEILMVLCSSLLCVC